MGCLIKEQYHGNMGRRAHYYITLVCWWMDCRLGCPWLVQTPEPSWVRLYQLPPAFFVHAWPLTVSLTYSGRCSRTHKQIGVVRTLCLSSLRTLWCGLLLLAFWLARCYVTYGSCTRFKELKEDCFTWSSLAPLKSSSVHSDEVWFFL